MIVVADTSALIALSSIGQLRLLRHLWPTVWITPAVVSELIAHGHNWKAAEEAQQEFAKGDWLLPWKGLVNCLSPPSKKLNRGELETISLAYQKGGTCFMDERLGRAFAKTLGISTVGSLGVLGRCKHLGFITAVRPLILEMSHQGLYFHPDLITQVLADMNE